jgi:agmatinase
MPWIDNSGRPNTDPYDTRQIPTECDPTRYNWNEQFWEKRDGSAEQMPPKPPMVGEVPGREPFGPIRVQRYNWGFHHYGFPTFWRLPLAMTKMDLNPALSNSTHFSQVDVAVVGYPSDSYAMRGPSFAPNFLRGMYDYRAWGATQDLASDTDQWLRVKPFEILNVVDFGNVNLSIFAPEETVTEARRVFLDILEGGAIPFVIGGSHDTQWPILLALSANGVAKEELYMVHIDAHYDGGSVGLGRYVHNGNALYWGHRMGLIDLEHVIQIGLRSASPDEHGLNWLRQATDGQSNGVKYHMMPELEYYKRHPETVNIGGEEVELIGFELWLHKILKEIPQDAKVYLSLDIDGMDQSYVPGTGGREINGLTPTQVDRILRSTAIKSQIVAFDVAEYNPLLDDKGNSTAIIVDRLMRTTLAGIAYRKKSIEDGIELNPYFIDCMSIQNVHQEADEEWKKGCQFPEK